MPASVYQVLLRKAIVEKIGGEKPVWYDVRKDGIQRLGWGYINPQTRTKIMKAAEEMGLRFDDRGYKISVFLPREVDIEQDWRPDSVIPEDYYGSR